MMPSSDDNFLLRAIQRGDEAAMTQLFDRYSRPVYSVAIRVLRDPAAAEDVLHEVFLHIWRKPEAYATLRDSLAPWLVLMARDRSMDTLRRKKSVDTVNEITIAQGAHIADDAARVATEERARTALLRLPSDQRKTLEMAFFDGLTHTEIAELSGEAPATIKTRIRTGLLYLRKAMQS